MSITTKYLDETLRVVGTFTDEAGDPTDPTTVTAGVIKGDGSTASITPTDEAGTGVWSAKYDLATDDPTGRYVIWIKGAISGFDVKERVVYNVRDIDD